LSDRSLAEAVDDVWAELVAWVIGVLLAGTY
jgi:hypothetical protein